MIRKTRTAPESKELSFELLGGINIHVAGNQIDTRYAKLNGLLAILAMSAGTELRRDYLAELFWPERADGVGRQNLRRALFNLKAAMGDASHLLLTSRDKIALLVPDSWVDALEIRSNVSNDSAKSSQQLAPDYIEQLEYAAELYRGEFMAGFSLADCPDFEEWLQTQRESLLHHSLNLLDTLSKHHQLEGNYRKALTFSLRHVELNPWDECAQRQVIQLYVLNGQNSAAIRHYDATCQLYKKELSVLPSVETQSLAGCIFNKELKFELSGTREASLPHTTHNIVMDSTAMWLNILDNDAKVVMWNKGAEQISGYREGEILGRGDIWELLYPEEEYRNQIFSKAQEIINQGVEVINFETTIRCKDGSSRVISWNSHEVKDDYGKKIGSLALGRDVTEIHTRNQKLSG
jgi:PAS domain S-box-containing protein